VEEQMNCNRKTLQELNKIMFNEKPQAGTSINPKLEEITQGIANVYFQLEPAEQIQVFEDVRNILLTERKERIGKLMSEAEHLGNFISLIEKGNEVLK
jgi:hypothetical protein